MSNSDYDVVLYKILRYAYDCMKHGIKPSIEQARKLANVNEEYFSSVLEDAQEKGLIKGVYIGHYCSSSEPVIYENQWRITRDGAAFIDENKSMKKIANAMGSVFQSALQAALAATAQSLSGMM